jgi:hypothetical protein
VTVPPSWETAPVILSWWWCLPLALAAVCAAASPAVVSKLRSETAEVEAVTSVVTLTRRRTLGNR